MDKISFYFVKKNLNLNRVRPALTSHDEISVETAEEVVITHNIEKYIRNYFFAYYIRIQESEKKYGNISKIKSPF